MSQQKVGIIAVAIVLVMAAGANVVFSDRPEDYDRLVLVKPILEADLVLIGDAQYLTQTKDEVIQKFSGVRILYDWSGQGKSKPAAKPGDSKPTASPAKAPPEIIVITPQGHVFDDPVIFEEQIVFLKIDRLTPDRLKEYRRGIVQEFERIGEKLSPAEKSDLENLLKGTELVCRPCSGWQSAIELDMDVESLEGKIFKERYKITKSRDVVAAIRSLCAWRDLKTQQEKIDYLLKLLNDNPRNQFYLDNVPELFESLGVNVEQKNGRYAAAPPGAKAPDDSRTKSNLPTITLQKAGELARKTMAGIKTDLDKLAEQFPVLARIGKSPVKGVAAPATEDDLVRLQIYYEMNVTHAPTGAGPGGRIPQGGGVPVVDKGGVLLDISLAQDLGMRSSSEQSSSEPFWLAKVAGGPRLLMYYFIRQNPPDPELTRSVASIVRAHAGQFAVQAAAVAVPEKKEPAFDPRVLTLPIQKGQYVFVGAYTGSHGGTQPGRDIRPSGRFHVSADAGSDEWEVRITMEKITTDDAEKVWKWEAAIRALAPYGFMQQREACADEDMIDHHEKPVQEVLIEKVDASREAGVQGLQFYKIPYVKVQGEVRYVVIATSSNMDLFPKAVAIPTWVDDWNWKEEWRELK